MGGRHLAAVAAGLLLASFVLSPVFAEDAPVDVCPANSPHKVICTVLCAGVLPKQCVSSTRPHAQHPDAPACQHIIA